MARKQLPPVQATSQQNEIKETVMKYAKNWYWFLAAIVLAMSLAFIYLQYVTPKYEVTARLQIREDNQNGSNVMEGTAFGDLNLFKKKTTVVNEVEVLRSRSLMYNVLNKLGLQTTYFVEGDKRKEELYGNTLPIKVTASNLRPSAYQKALTIEMNGPNAFTLSDGSSVKRYHFGQTIRKAYGTLRVDRGPNTDLTDRPVEVKFRNLAKLAEAYSNSEMEVQPVTKEASTVTLTVTDAIPERGLDILNGVIEGYNTEVIDNKNQLALSTLKFIDDRLKTLTSDLSSVEKNVEAYKRQNELTDVNTNAQMYVQQAGAYGQQLAQGEIQLNLVQSVESYVGKSGSDYNLVPSSLGLQDPTLSGLIGKFNELQLERQRLLRTLQPGNPIVQNINEQLSGLRSNIRENLSNVKKGLQITRNRLASSAGQAEGKIRQVPGAERQLLEIQRQHGIKSNLYNYLLQKREETALSLAANVSNSAVIDEPSATTDPVSPKKPLIYLCAFVAGILLPFSGMYVKDLFNEKINNATDIEQITGLSILGELSHKGNDGTVVVKRESRTTISELFRYIRSNLQYMTGPINNKVLLVTSSMKGEGKTFFTINLGATLAMADKKVVILEFDLRKPDLLKNIDLKYEKGLTYYLSTPEAEVSEIINDSNILPTLHVISAGSIPENPAELLLSPKMETLIDTLKEQYDYVIIDTSPVGQVADAFTIAPYTDASIYVVRYNYTYKLQLSILEDITRNKKLKNPMIVMNDSKKGGFKGYGYAYGYGYGATTNA